MSERIFFICNTVTGQATTSGPTAEQIEHAYHARWAGKRSPVEMICEFSRMLGITIHNFSDFPRSMIWDGVATYAKRKAGVS